MKLHIHRISPVSAIMILGAILVSLPIILLLASGHERKADDISKSTTALVCQIWNDEKSNPNNSFSSLNRPNMLTENLLKKTIVKTLAENSELAEDIKNEQRADFSFRRTIEKRAEVLCNAESNYVGDFFNMVDTFH